MSLQLTRRKASMSWRNGTSSCYVYSRGYRNQWANPSYSIGTKQWKKRYALTKKWEPKTVCFLLMFDKPEVQLLRSTRSCWRTHKRDRFVTCRNKIGLHQKRWKGTL